MGTPAGASGLLIRKMGTITISWQQLFPDSWERQTVKLGGNRAGTLWPLSLLGTRYLLVWPILTQSGRLRGFSGEDWQAGSSRNRVASKEARGRAQPILMAGIKFLFWFLRLHSCQEWHHLYPPETQTHTDLHSWAQQPLPFSLSDSPLLVSICQFLPL